MGWDAKSSRSDLGQVGTEISFVKSEIRLDRPVKKPPDGQISRPSHSTRKRESSRFSCRVTALFWLVERVEQDTGLKCLFKLDCVVDISETENPFHPYLRRSMSKQRVAMLPSKAQQQAIEARLNFALGAETYDRLFLGFICGDVDNDTVDIFVQNEDTAAIVCTGYSWHVAVVVESVMKKSIKCVNVLPKNLSQMR